MADVTLPTAAPLARLADIELIHTGTWDLSSGPCTFTADDLRAAVASQDCPAVRRPILKLGHVDPRFDGEPAVGYVANLATDAAAHTLRGDYAGMPGWLGDVLASAFPDRSIEGTYDFVCQLGHTHPFVVTAVALLGVTPPGVGTLASLQDIAELYGVRDVAAATTTNEAAQHVAVTITAAKEATTMPHPNPRKVAATASVEDVRRAFYDSPAGQSWNTWIEEIQLDPLQLIVIDDATGQRTRVPVTVDPSKDGAEAVTFADAVPVIIRYQDTAAEPVGVAASARVVWASRRESRGGIAAAASPAGLVEELTLSVEDHDTINKLLGLGPATDGPLIIETLRPITDALDSICTLLGVPTDSEPPTIVEALKEVLDEQVTASADSGSVTASGARGRDIPADAVVLDAGTYGALVSAAKARDGLAADSLRQRRQGIIEAAVRDGRIPPASRQHWATLLESDPAGETTLASLPKGLVPLDAIGHSGSGVTASSASDQLYSQIFPEEA
jgi:hypothetical protein